MTDTTHATSVAEVWRWIDDHFHTQRTRLDRVIPAPWDGKPHIAPMIEVGYGSRTIRVRVYSGPNLIGLVDLRSDATLASQDRMLLIIDKLATKVGFTKVEDR